MKQRIANALVGAGLLALLAGCERPPIETEQVGYRGTGMLTVNNPRLGPEAEPPVPPPLPPAAEGGPMAADIYQNVQVLDDLTVAEFTRLMTAMTAWVSPEEGCNYCHVPGNLASDDIYTKVVSRNMIAMTRHINTVHETHVGDTGVTCYTCHRGQAVPAELWTIDPGPQQPPGLVGWHAGQNMARSSSQYASLPFDPFERYLIGETEIEDIRVIPTTALPAGTNDANIKDTEWNYSLMMHISDSLGVNCTYCHNSRAFLSWPESAPARLNAWHGLRMVAELNENYLSPLDEVLPDFRLGVMGDAPKANCATCHRGLPKPLGGQSMLVHYPALDVPLDEAWQAAVQEP
jgi:photosynthetic reaction center cytochrome c subunit